MTQSYYVLYFLSFFAFITHTVKTTTHPNFTIAFDQAMICNPLDFDTYQAARNNQTDAHFFEYAQQQYTTHILEKPDYGTAARIPKIIHQIWIGPDAPPEKFNEWQATWHKYHPDWQYKLWTNDDVAHFPLINKKQFDQEKNFGAKADILRLEILNRYGGLYVDIDGECLQPFDTLHHLCDFYIGFFQVNFLRQSARVNNALMACTPGHPLIQALIHEISLIQAPEVTAEWTVVERTGPSFVSRVLKEHIYKAPGINIIVPANYFYPWTGTQRKLKLAVQPETMAIHHYAGTWKAKLPVVEQGTERYADRKKERAHKKATLLKAFELFDKIATDQNELDLDISTLNNANT